MSQSHKPWPRPEQSSKVTFRTRERRCEGPPRGQRRGFPCLQIPFRAVPHRSHLVTPARSRSTRSVASRSSPGQAWCDSSKRSAFTPSRSGGPGASVLSRSTHCLTKRATREREESGGQEGPGEAESRQEVSDEKGPGKKESSSNDATSTRESTHPGLRLPALPGLQ